MTCHLSESEVRSIAECARVSLSGDEARKLTEELNAIVETLEPLLGFEEKGRR